MIFWLFAVKLYCPPCNFPNFSLILLDMKADTKTTEFAVIQTGGKQYKVKAGDSLKIEKLPGDHKKGDKIVFDKVLLVDDGENTSIGMPYIDGAKVEAEFES